MDEILTVIKAIEPIGIAILIWRQRVADWERTELMKRQAETQLWIESLVSELLRKTEIR